MRTLLTLTVCFFLAGFLAAQYAPSIGQEQEHRQHQQQQQDRNDIEQQERGTSDVDVMDDNGLPATASPLPLAGLLSLLSMGGAVTIRALRK